MEQRSPEWFAARCGKVTASRICDVMAKTKSGPAASRLNYMAELIAQRLTGVTVEGYTNAAMQWGTDTEPDACAAYEFFTGSTVVPVGFIDHPSIAMSGASPDGHIGKQGSIEIKCPNTSTHIELLLGGVVPEKYMPQIQFQMACSGRKWCEFVSYDPRMPEDLKMFVKRVARDEKRIAEIEAAVVEFIAEIDVKVGKLLSLRLGLPEREAA